MQANVGRIVTPTQHSYRVKHVAENALGHYVSNGELIAAALLDGYRMRRLDGPNALLGMRAADLQAAAQIARSR